MEDDYDDGYSMEQEEADFQQAELERLGRQARALERAGICVHGWRQGYSPKMAAKYRGRIQPGQQLCLNCGKLGTEAELDAEREAAFDGVAKRGRDAQGLASPPERR